MAPRKRLRPNPAEASSSSLPTNMPTCESSGSQGTFRTESSAATAPTMSSPIHQGGKDVPSSIPNLAKQVHKTRSWYGSWPRLPKSSASTQLAREHILGGTLQPASTPDFTRFESKKPGLDDGSESTPPTQTTESNTVDLPKPDDSSKMDVDEAPEPQSQLAPTDLTPSKDQDSIKTTEPVPDAVSEPGTPQRPSTSSGWLGGWFGRSPAPTIGVQSQEQRVELSGASDAMNPPDSNEQEIPKGQETPKVQEAPKAQEIPKAHGFGESPRPEPGLSPVRTASAEVSKPRSTSWFGMWSINEETATQKLGESSTSTTEPPQVKEADDVVMQDAPPANPALLASADPKTESEIAHPPPAGSTWVFWSRATRPTSGGTSTPQMEDGELAVAGQESATHPQHATSQDIQEPPPKDKKDKKKAKQSDETSTPRPIRGKSNKRLRPQSMDIDTPTPSPPKSSSLKSDKDSLLTKPDKSPSKAGSSKAELSNATPAKEIPSKASTSKNADSKTTPSSASAKALPPNILLPTFKSTYRMKENPSILQQIGEFLLRTKQPPAKHVFRAKEAPKIKNAISIGVHGLFPAKYITPLIGAPTGTSMRFAALGADAIQRWADENGCSDCEIEKVCLEGEGRIAERVDNLWKLLLNWIDHLRKADLIIISCHSQGVPVSVMLLAKLLDMGIISEARIGVCAMAGVSLGPFPDYKSGMGMFMGSAAELWEFSNPQSELAQRYEHALKEVLEYGVRITFVGSIDDQLVPMESAIHSPANHPYIYRAVFIDGRIHAPDFIAHLIGFALKLRNLGVSDHGLIRELSIPLAGSLYGGEGHSRLYYDDQVYDLAVIHALETTSVPKHPCHIQKFENLAATNPYTLPWVMRGLLEENFVKTELSAETDELLKQFDTWKPTTKALKDVKYRLEAVRSRL